MTAVAEVLSVTNPTVSEEVTAPQAAMIERTTTNGDLPHIHCLFHQNNLLSTAIAKVITNERPATEPSSTSSTISKTGVDTLTRLPSGMNAATGNNVTAATDVMYRLSKALSLSAKAGERGASWAKEFAAFQLDEENSAVTIGMLHSNRLHVYEMFALKLYGERNVVLRFLEGRAESWTRTYLLQGLANGQTRKELRVLAVLGYCMAKPFASYHARLSVMQSIQLLKAERDMLLALGEHAALEGDTKEVTLDKFWLHCESACADNFATENAKKKKEHEYARKLLRPVLDDWDVADAVLFATVRECRSRKNCHIHSRSDRWRQVRGTSSTSWAFARKQFVLRKRLCGPEKL